MELTVQNHGALAQAKLFSPGLALAARYHDNLRALEDGALLARISHETIEGPPQTILGVLPDLIEEVCIFSSSAV